jgi:hypothetical protein
MLLTNLEEHQQEHFDAELTSLSRELSQTIEKAKALARSCKLGHYEET